MEPVRILQSYSDDFGNVIEYDGPPIESKVSIEFHGSNNFLRVAKNTKIVDLKVKFTGDGGRVKIAGTYERRVGIRANIRVGHDCAVAIGKNTGMQSRARIYAAEGTKVLIGTDCMFASNVEIRTDDSHAIYDVGTGNRVNTSKTVRVGDHVWLGKDAVVTGGASIGSGSVVGLRSVVTKAFPNNCTVVGVPARAVRRNIAWERPTLGRRKPGVIGQPKGHKKSSDYWRFTEVEETASSQTQRGTNPVKRFLKPAAKRIVPDRFHRSLRQAITRIGR